MSDEFERGWQAALASHWHCSFEDKRLADAEWDKLYARVAELEAALVEAEPGSEGSPGSASTGSDSGAPVDGPVTPGPTELGLRTADTFDLPVPVSGADLDERIADLAREREEG